MINTQIIDTKTFTSLDALTNWEKNPRSIKKDAFERLKTHIRDHGQMQPLVVTPEGVVLGGNMRLRAYHELSIDPVWVEVVEPKDEAEKLRIALVLNDRAGFYDDDLLANLIPEYPDFNWDEYAVDLKEPVNLGELIERFTPVEEDEAPRVETGDAVSKLGEVYQLGRHRLMCGDATRIEDVEQLMDEQKADMVFTDPPYGVSYGDKNAFLNAIAPANRIQENLENDTKSVGEMKSLWTDAFTNCNAVSKAGAAYYGCSPQGGELMMMMMAWLEAGWELKQQIIWVKNNIVLGRSDYHYKHEPLLYGWKTGQAHKFYGGYGESTVWEINKPQVSDLHPTMKPIALITKAINNSTKAEDVILDLFGGSGSTLIACEQTNRTCYMMELDPRYCDVIRKRYAKFIGDEERWQEVTPVIDYGQNQLDKSTA